LYATSSIERNCLTSVHVSYGALFLLLIQIKPPPGVTAQHLDIEISHMQLRVGIKGNPPFLDQATGAAMVAALRAVVVLSYKAFFEV